MPAPPVLAEATIAAADQSGLPDIQHFPVPPHWPPAGPPPESLSAEPLSAEPLSAESLSAESLSPESLSAQAGRDRGGLRSGGAAREAGAGFSGPGDADPADGGPAWPRQFAVLLAEALAGVRPARQLQPWLSERGRVHLHRLLPLFADGHQPRITRVLTTRPAQDVIEMTLIITAGRRTRALAVRLERVCPAPPPAWGENLARRATGPRSPAAPWRCTDIEAA